MKSTEVRERLTPPSAQLFFKVVIYFQRTPHTITLQFVFSPLYSFVVRPFLVYPHPAVGKEAFLDALLHVCVRGDRL